MTPKPASHNKGERCIMTECGSNKGGKCKGYEWSDVCIRKPTKPEEERG